MTQIERITQEERQAAKTERDGLFELGAQLQTDWIAFHLAVVEFRKSVVKGSYKWELCGYRNWGQFVKVLCKKIGESRTVFYEKLKAVECLPPAKIRELGTKTKIFAAKRLVRAGKLTPEVEEKLKKSSADGARKLAKKLSKPTEESRTQLTLNLLDSQYSLVMYQMARIKRLFGFETAEQTVDLIYGDIASCSDDDLLRRYNTGVEPVHEVRAAS